MNPWWEGRGLPELPATRRHLVRQIHRRLESKLAPAVVVRGPRQVGKTTAQLQVLGDLLHAGASPRSILRVQFDQLGSLATLSEPLLRLVDWYEEAILGMSLNEAARQGRPAILAFDEIQNLTTWAPELKFLVDHSTVQVLVTGSSALRIEKGRDSLAGRITTLEAGVLSLTEIAAFRGLDLGGPFLPDNGPAPLLQQDFWLELREHGRRRKEERDLAFGWFSERGGYPLAHQRSDLDPAALADQLNETIIRRVLRHDLGRSQRNADLYEELLRLACRYAGQAPGPLLLAREAGRALGQQLSLPRVRRAMGRLEDTLLIRRVPPLQIRLKRTQGFDKICLCDPALRASWLGEAVPLAPAALEQEPHLTSLAGRIAESVVGSTLATITHLDLAHRPGSPSDPELDFVLTVGTRRIPLEVKYQRKVDPLDDTYGLRTFLEQSANNAPFGLLIAQTDEVTVADPRIVCLPLSTLMLLR